MSKALPRTSRLLVVLALGTFEVTACGGGGKGSESYPDASTFGSGGTVGAAGGAAGSKAGTPAGGSSGTATGGTGGGSIVFPGTGGTGTTNGGATGTTGVPPAAGSTALISATALLMGPGATCSTPPATTTPAPDRWCGVFVPSGNQQVGLLAFDLTKALAGTAITCTATDTNCVLLSANIDVNQNDTDTTYGFFGQTLIYYDATTIYAWRPGWTAGRNIMAHSTAQPVQCAAAPSDATSAICLASSNNNLYAGSIATQTGSTLPLVEALTNGSTGIDFSPDGLSVIWSVVSGTSGPAETLKMQTVGDATTKKTIASNVTEWAISTDATRWYWLSAPATDANGITTGTLQTAPYPAGTAPATIASKVGQYLLYGTKSAVTLTTAAATTATGADMNVVADVGAPTTSTTLVEGMDVIGLLDVNSTGNILYATMADQPDPTSSNYLVDLHLIKSDGTAKCAATATPNADPGAAFNTSGSAVEWVQVTLDSSANVTAVTGQYTTVADCGAHPFSSSLYTFYDVTSGLLIQQNLQQDTTTGSVTADIDYAALAATGAPGTATLVQASADPTIVPLFPTPGRVLYTLSSGSSTDGVYATAALIAATPDLAPVPHPLGSTAPRLIPNTAQVAQSHFAKNSIPHLIAAPTSLTRPLSTQPTLPFFSSHFPHALSPTHLLRPLSRTNISR